VIDFAYPADAAASAHSDPIEAKVTSTMTITFQRPAKLPDGTSDPSRYVYRDEDVQTWVLEDVACERPFTVEPEWRPVAVELSPLATGEPFCRDGAGGARECVEYVVRYTADRCRFTIRDGVFKFAAGSPPARAHVAGHFDRYDESGEPAGYTVHVTNVEFL
jgi:hypothetical protein